MVRACSNSEEHLLIPCELLKSVQSKIECRRSRQGLQDIVSKQSSTHLRLRLMHETEQTSLGFVVLQVLYQLKRSYSGDVNHHGAF